MLHNGLDEFARPFTPEQFALVQRELDGEPAHADLFVAGFTTSTFDVAWCLARDGLLPEWGAVLALGQEEGRGQLRREWFSSLGNLHVSFRLPGGGLFAGRDATVLLGLMFCEVFSELGLELCLKWPNDLVLESGGIHGKLGGILLEERNGLLVAGVGINCIKIPDRCHIRPNAALLPVHLPENFPFRSPLGLWLRLVRRLIMIYSELFMATSRLVLLRRTEERLLWRGREVLVSESGYGEAPLRGVLAGLSDDGGLLLLAQGENGMPTSRVITSGSIVGV